VRTADTRLPLIAAWLLITTGCYPSQSLPVSAVWTEQHQLEFSDRLPQAIEIWARRGHVLIKDGAELSGTIAIDVRAATRDLARTQAESAEIQQHWENGRLRIECSHAEGADLDAVAVRCQLEVPPDIRVIVHSADAEIALRGYRGHAEASTDSGAISAYPAGGDCQLSTQSGSIDLLGQFDNAQLTSTSGRISVAVPATSTRVHLEIDTHDGRVSVDMSQTCKMLLSYTTGSGQLRSEFPVRWETNGQDAGDGRKLYAGVLGELECPAQVETIVEQQTGVFVVRRTPTGGESHRVSRGAARPARSPADRSVARH